MRAARRRDARAPSGRSTSSASRKATNSVSTRSRPALRAAPSPRRRSWVTTRKRGSAAAAAAKIEPVASRDASSTRIAVHSVSVCARSESSASSAYSATSWPGTITVTAAGVRVIRSIVRRPPRRRPRRRRPRASCVDAVGQREAHRGLRHLGGSIPIATSTCEGSSLPAAHAEPLEETTPRRSSSSSTASPLVPAKVKLAVPGSRCIGMPGQRRARHAVEHAGDEVVAQPGDAGGCLLALRLGEVEGGRQRDGARDVLGAAAASRAPGRRRACSGSRGMRPRTTSAPVPFGAPIL